MIQTHDLLIMRYLLYRCATTSKTFFQCMDFGFHQSLYRAMMMHSSGLDQVRRSLQVDIDSVGKALSGLDSRLDKQRFFEYNNAAFMIPKKFEYNPVRRDEVKKWFLKNSGLKNIIYFYIKKLNSY